MNTLKSDFLEESIRLLTWASLEWVERNGLAVEKRLNIVVLFQSSPLAKMVVFWRAPQEPKISTFFFLSSFSLPQFPILPLSNFLNVDWFISSS